MTFKRFALICLICLVAGACGKQQEPQPPTLSEAHEKFFAIAKDEYGLNVVLKPLKNTVWIYVPIEEGIVDYKATPSKAVDTKTGNEIYNVNYLDTQYVPDDKKFVVEYDISMIKSYPKDLGYGSSFSEGYNKIYQSVFQAIQRSYFNVREAKVADEYPMLAGVAGDDTVKRYEPTEGAPEFFVITITDITRGVEIQFLIYLEDYKKQASGHLPHEEALRRIIYEVRGDQDAIDDKQGQHLNVHEVAMPDFLARQITTRINFKYGQSTFPPSADTQKEILYQVYETFAAYEFKDFISVELHDMRADTTETIPQHRLKDYKDMPLPEGGKLHTIKFFN